MSADPLSLFAEATEQLPRPEAGPESRAIEAADFPFEDLSAIAELESWRKEIHRPVYHIHKWWAQRLGSVFRAIILGTFAPAGSDLLSLFYRPIRLPNVTVLDPFMGSGTTIGETLKLGGRAIGFDINPVAHFLVKNALGMPKRSELLEAFRAIEQDVVPRIRRYYETRLPDGRKAEVLYYFWVKQVPCPRCKLDVDLFSSYVFAAHAYRDRHPTAQILCAACGAVNVARFDARSVRCASCRKSFDPQAGPARGTKAMCPRCNQTFPIAKTVRERGRPPKHRLYAKLVLRPSGEKAYLAADQFDLARYREAEQELTRRETPYPMVQIAPGYNTNQVLNYCYTHWHQMFNARQLLSLSILADCIRAIPDARVREVFACLFSGVLEFNNMFTSFKGEGTGAVRHMFYHHILKPEREPLEANLWGTPRSSGAFSTLFRTRILRALDYCEDPFELRITQKGARGDTTKVYGLSAPLNHDAAQDYSEFSRDKMLYLACCDSASTDLPTESVDAVITDPPFFDNVHYSQLADFFHVWQRHILGPRRYYDRDTTRSEAEVQQSDSTVFTERLTGVWQECARVLKPNGLLVFTYHHSRLEGWRAVLASLLGAGFVVVRTHPIKSEMSVATPKHQAREPIDLDMIIVCRKRSAATNEPLENPQDLVNDATKDARAQLRRLAEVGRHFSRNDVRVVLMAQALARLSRIPLPEAALQAFDAVDSSVEKAIDRLQSIRNDPREFAPRT